MSEAVALSTKLQNLIFWAKGSGTICQKRWNLKLVKGLLSALAAQSLVGSGFRDQIWEGSL